MKYSITCDNLEKIQEFPYLIPFHQSNILNPKFTPAEIRTETCFIGLCIMSYLIPKRVDIVREIETFIEENKANFLGDNMPKLLKSRFCLFLGYFSDTLFQVKDHQQQFSELILYLVKCATDLNEHPSVQYQAVDSLTNIYDD